MPDTPPREEHNTGDQPRATVIDTGEFPFAILDDGRVVIAEYVTTFTPQPPFSLSDEESTEYQVRLDGQRFRILASGKSRQAPWLPITSHDQETGPQTAQPDGHLQVVTTYFFYVHHLGWLSGPVTFRFDPVAMTVLVEDELKFDPD